MDLLRCVLALGAALLPLVAAAQDADRPAGKGVRNVILLIGDGMGPQEINLLALHARYAETSEAPGRVAAMERLISDGYVGIVRTEPHDALVVDSAAAATQLATGEYAGSEMIGINYRGERVETVVEAAHRVGKSAGLVTNTRITHATPAGFAAHQTNRHKENEIAVDFLAGRVEVLLGGGLRNWVPQSINAGDRATYAAIMNITGGAYAATSMRRDNRNLLLEARESYRLAFDRHQLADAGEMPLLGLFADSELPDALLERQTLANDATRRAPTLVEMATKAIDLLNEDPDGFFLMVECGQIDWAGHNNDAGTMLHEMLRMDALVRAVSSWTRERDDTLLIITADHETGGFGFSYSGRPLPEPAPLPGEAFAGEEFAPYFNYAPPELLDLLYAQRASFFTMFTKFDSLPRNEQTPERLVEIVNAGSEAKITLDDAKAALTRATNLNYVEGHPYLSAPTVPQIRDFEAFYVYGENLRMNQLARRLAPQLHVVWGSGTHTSTPVLVIAHGPDAAAKKFTGLMHATDVGKRMIELVTGGQASRSASAGR